METFRTSNLNEIAVLLAYGKKQTSVEKDNNSNRLYFIFFSDDCKSIVDSYYKGENVVSPLAFCNGLRQAKDIIFSKTRG